MAETYVKFQRGLIANYNALPIKDNDTLYFVYNEDSTEAALYLGTRLIAGSADLTGASNLTELQDVLISNVANKDILQYNGTQWVNLSFEDLLSQLEESLNISTSSSTQIFETVVTTTDDVTETHLEAIARVVGTATPIQGDIAIVKVPIGEDTDKYEYTSYVYDAENGWIAMDGNYSAENVYFAEDLLTTSAVGNITLTNGQATISAAGKNLKQVFETIFVKEKDPSAVTVKAITTLNEAGSYEVGTKITPTYSTKLDVASKYTYGPTTGVSVTAYSVTDSNNSATLTTASGSFAEIQVTDATNYTVTATLTHSDGNVPVTNLGNACTAKQIKAGNVSDKSDAITGYRNAFYGSVSNKNEITSDVIRSLTASGKALANGNTFDVAVDVGAVRVIIAYPDTLNDISSIKDVNGLNAEIYSAATFPMIKVDVEGANGYDAISYKVFYTDYAEAVAEGKANTYTVTL